VCVFHRWGIQFFAVEVRRMGRRGSGGSLLARLLPRMEEFIAEHGMSDNTDDMIAYLRVQYPEYSRMQLQPFTKAIDQCKTLYFYFILIFLIRKK
jgi:hypothetical protein